MIKAIYIKISNKNAIFLMRRQDCGDKTRYFKPKYNVF